jgi:hypothetical protein
MLIKYNAIARVLLSLFSFKKSNIGEPLQQKALIELLAIPTIDNHMSWKITTLPQRRDIFYFSTHQIFKRAWDSTQERFTMA